MTKIMPIAADPDKTMTYCINTMNAGLFELLKVKLFGKKMPDLKEGSKIVGTRYYKGKIYLWSCK